MTTQNIGEQQLEACAGSEALRYEVTHNESEAMNRRSMQKGASHLLQALQKATHLCLLDC